MATKENEIVLGNENTTVYIPGNLVVGGFTGTRHMYIDSHLIVYEPKVQFMRRGEEFYRVVVEDGSFDSSLSKDSVLKYDTVTNWTRYHKKHADGTSTDSDRRLKDVGEVFKAGLEEVKKLEVFNYTFKKDPNKTPRVGVMAQDLEKIFPKAVFKGDDGFLRIRMEDMFYAVVNAVKELSAKIDLLEQKQKKINELEKRLDKLEKRLVKLEKKSKKTDELVVLEEE